MARAAHVSFAITVAAAILGAPAQAGEPGLRPGEASFASEAKRSPEPGSAASRLESILGREVRTRDEGDSGRIVDLLAEPNGNVHAVVIEFGGFLGIGTRKIAVEWRALQFEGLDKQPVAIVDVTRDQLRVAPEWKPGEPAAVLRAAR